MFDWVLNTPLYGVLNPGLNFFENTSNASSFFSFISLKLKDLKGSVSQYSMLSLVKCNTPLLQTARFPNILKNFLEKWIFLSRFRQSDYLQYLYMKGSLIYGRMHSLLKMHLEVLINYTANIILHNSCYYLLWNKIRFTSF